MSRSHKMDRRAACAAMFGVGGSLLPVNRCLAGGPSRRKGKRKPALCFENSDFYDSQGKFNEEAAKKAYWSLIKWFG